MAYHCKGFFESIPVGYSPRRLHNCALENHGYIPENYTMSRQYTSKYNHISCQSLMSKSFQQREKEREREKLFVRVSMAVRYAIKCSMTSHNTSTGLLGTFQASNIGERYTKKLFRSCSTILANLFFDESSPLIIAELPTDIRLITTIG